MQFLHKRMHLNTGDIVIVECSHQANILLTTDSNFNSYKNSIMAAVGSLKGSLQDL